RRHGRVHGRRRRRGVRPAAAAARLPPARAHAVVPVEGALAAGYPPSMSHRSDPHSSTAAQQLELLPATAEIDTTGRLLIGGCALERVAELFGTPAFVVDEVALRETARTFREAFLSRHGDTRVCFASKD